MTAQAVNDIFDTEKNNKRKGYIKKLNAFDRYNLPLLDYSVYSNYKITAHRRTKGTRSSILFNPEKIGVFDGIEGVKNGTVFFPPLTTICIAEAQRYYSARNWQKFERTQSEFFEFNRHYGLTIWLDTQNGFEVDKNIRGFVQVYYIIGHRLINYRDKCVQWCKNIDFKRIEFDYYFFDRYTCYEKFVQSARFAPKKQTFITEDNIYLAYNPTERYTAFLPKNKGARFYGV